MFPGIVSRKKDNVKFESGRSRNYKRQAIVESHSPLHRDFTLCKYLINFYMLAPYILIVFELLKSLSEGFGW
jgi:hypothetical protein